MMKTVIVGPDGLNHLEGFAAGMEAQAHEASREMTKLVKDDEDLLTAHADRMRTVSARMVLFKGYIAALRINPESTALRLEALATWAYLRASFEAMRYDIRDR